jgi:hypothetical protein
MTRSVCLDYDQKRLQEVAGGDHSDQLSPATIGRPPILCFNIGSIGIRE